VNGHDVPPLVVRDARAQVLVFIGLECPIANGYSPELAAIEQEYGPRGVRMLLVCVDRDATPERVSQHAAEYGLGPEVLLDPGHELVQALGATVTPECFVLDARSRPVYRGRIDDQYAELGRKRPAPKHHELRETLDALLAGRAVPTARTEAVGCRIEVSAGVAWWACLPVTLPSPRAARGSCC
jgi:hypothetical protein